MSAANVVHILPGDTPVWLAMMTAHREGMLLLNKGDRTILSSAPVAGFKPLFVAVKS